MARNHNSLQSDNIFMLSKLTATCHYNSVEVNFIPLSRSNNLFESIAPRYNCDGSYFTPAFCLSADHDYYASNSDFEMEKFLERVKKAQENITNQAPQMASPSSTYCQVCRSTYQNYEIHISSKQHTTRTKSSKANLYMRELCTKLHKQKSKARTHKNKPVRKECQTQRQIRKSQRILNKKLQGQWGFLNGLLTKSFINNSTNLVSWTQVKP